MLAFGVLADRALVGQARAARERAPRGADETARLTALSVRAALTADRTGSGGRPAPPDDAGPSVSPSRPRSLLPVVPVPPYASRSRAELSRLLSSDGTTPSGLPEAVVARLRPRRDVRRSPAPNVRRTWRSYCCPANCRSGPTICRISRGAWASETIRACATLQERLRLIPACCGDPEPCRRSGAA